MSISRTTLASSNACQPKAKEPTSQKKIVANRKNALRSTGPRTLDGKRAVSRNAIKHGLLASEVVNIVQGESSELFHSLLEELCDEFQPVGWMEQMLVERIATSWWRLRRVVQAEKGELFKGIVAAKRKFGTSDARTVRDFTDGELVQCMWEGNDRITFYRGILRDVKAEFEETGCLSDRLRTEVQAFSQASRGFLGEVTNGDGRVLDENKLKAFLTNMEHELSLREALHEETEKQNKIELEAELGSLCLPSEDATAKLLRYEAQLDRQLYRALAELERRQMQRNGQIVPPRVHVQLTREP